MVASGTPLIIIHYNSTSKLCQKLNSTHTCLHFGQVASVLRAFKMGPFSSKHCKWYRRCVWMKTAFRIESDGRAQNTANDTGVWMKTFQVEPADAGYKIWPFAYCNTSIQIWQVTATQSCRSPHARALFNQHVSFWHDHADLHTHALQQMQKDHQLTLVHVLLHVLSLIHALKS